MAKEKLYTIKRISQRGVESIQTKTFKEWMAYYGVKASNIKTLIAKVQKEYSEREAACYNRTSITLID